jgi:hypothetical protein
VHTYNNPSSQEAEAGLWVQGQYGLHSLKNNFFFPSSNPKSPHNNFKKSLNSGPDTKCSNTETTSSLFALVYFSDRVSWFLPRAGSKPESFYLHLPQVGLQACINTPGTTTQNSNMTCNHYKIMGKLSWLPNILLKKFWSLLILLSKVHLILFIHFLHVWLQ